MRLGVSFPQREPGIGTDLGAIKAYVQAAESLGYRHFRTGEHVLGANPDSRPDWQGPYGHADIWHEPLVLFGYLAGITSTLELVTSIVILPQRQTVLVAKQAAEVDVLSGGRLRLGIGVGWNDVEYEALGEEFSNRGARCEEQIAVLRALWTQELVTFEGRWHKITDAGINPLPVQRPIPIWIGGGPGSVRSRSSPTTDRVLRRIATMADGWFPSTDLKGVRDMLPTLHKYTRAAGRDPAEVGVEGSVSAVQGGPEEWVGQAETWKELGASHISTATASAGFTSVDQHIDALRRFKEAVTEVVD